jgi:hypothetical protein
VLTLALLLTMAVLIFAGIARGETGRVWLFFAPFVLMSAAAGLQTEKSGRSWLLLSGAQVALLLVVAGTWVLINAPNMSPPPESPGPVTAHQPVDAVFADSFRLVGWDAQPTTNRIQLHLNWQDLNPVTTPYWFSALLVAPDGSLPQESQVWQGLDTRYPTTCWQPGEIVGDTISLPLPDDAQSGDWWLSLSVFADKSDPEDRLLVTLPDGTIDNQVGIGPIRLR